ncbi:hypothetical protein ZWY2020_031315 [Hordeum vulgare]|nr:hypothetical protein ZWY2020_031315 [Hordeum vulgare]
MIRGRGRRRGRRRPRSTVEARSITSSPPAPSPPQQAPRIYLIKLPARVRVRLRCPAGPRRYGRDRRLRSRGSFARDELRLRGGGGGGGGGEEERGVAAVQGWEEEEMGWLRVEWR